MIVSSVGRLFQVDDEVVWLLHSSESQQREIPIKIGIFVIDDHLQQAMEEPLQYPKMVPASKEAIQMLLKKYTIMTQGSECCSICLEEMVINAECYTMPCHHYFHQQCIVSWLETSHVCPLCRFPLPTIKN
uniref:RING-type E3 ubiquitin transferase n=1 Tax=Cajanus cajan TaxID=3821 RepID=A0A151RHN9_CAJCA|nr:E3 ubiquitin-protein ligase Praja1 [Cajanus cajan]